MKVTLKSKDHRNKVYFASDFHLGIADTREREKKIVRWLEEISHNARHIYLVGDLFDFWYEYAYTVPKGAVRLLGKLAELTDAGVDITIFTGNHDMWMKSYLVDEVGVDLVRDPIEVELFDKKLLIGHGDGLGPGDHGYKLLKKIFANPLCQWLYARLHPNFSFWLAQFFSSMSRGHTEEKSFLGPEKEWLIQYCEEYLSSIDDSIDYFIFGHRHLKIDYTLSNGRSRYINLGDWISYYTYAVLDEEGSLQLRAYGG